MSEHTKRGPGRPLGELFPVKKLLRFTQAQAEALAGLAAAESVSEAEIVRGLVEQAWDKHGLAARVKALERRLPALEPPPTTPPPGPAEEQL